LGKNSAAAAIPPAAADGFLTPNSFAAIAPGMESQGEGEDEPNMGSEQGCDDYGDTPVGSERGLLESEAAGAAASGESHAILEFLAHMQRSGISSFEHAESVAKDWAVYGAPAALKKPRLGS
jgi:hypothetical protein